jgi:hypothetical protein
MIELVELTGIRGNPRPRSTVERVKTGIGSSLDGIPFPCLNQQSFNLLLHVLMFNRASKRGIPLDLWLFIFNKSQCNENINFPLLQQMSTTSIDLNFLNALVWEANFLVNPSSK